MATAGNNQTITSSRTRIFDSEFDGGRCHRFLIGCRSSSPHGILINIPQLHLEDEFVGVPAGAFVAFEVINVCQINGITDVFVKGDGGNAIIDYGVIAKYTN